MHTVKDEIDILYATSNKLTQSSTPAEWLEAVSDYARDIGATAGVLFYFHDDPDGQPDYIEIVAEWVIADGRSAGVGARFGVSTHIDFIRQWLSTPDRPTLITNVLTSDLVPPVTRAVYAQYGISSSAILPLNTKSRWIGALMFTWTEPYIFDERDQRIFTAVLQQAAPVIDSVRLFDQNRERITRAEHLLRINTALSQATDEEQILAGLALYTELKHADVMTLNYLDVDEELHPVHSRTVAVWKEGQTFPYIPANFKLISMADFRIKSLWVDNPTQAFLVENLAAEERIPLERREAMLAAVRSRAFVVIPLYSGGRYQGVLTVLWFQPHTFSDEEKYIYSALMQTLSSVVASRRAYLAADEARHETELLYRASKGINAAATFAEIIDAVEQLNLSSLNVMLTVWENYHNDGAAYMKVVACGPGSRWTVGDRVSVENLPASKAESQHELFIVEDINDPNQLDTTPAHISQPYGYQSLMAVPLRLGGRFIGILGFESETPRQYSDREKRLAAGIGDLVAAAVERIRLKEETEIARQRAEMLAKANIALSQATNEHGILAAISILADRYGAALSTLAYLDVAENNQLHAINIVAVRSSDGTSPLPPEFLPVTYVRTENYPIFQLAYSNPDEPIFIEDVQSDPRAEAGNTRNFSQTLGWAAIILIPLKSAEQWQGILTFVWESPQVFTPEIKALFSEIRPSVASVVTSRRAYLAEEEARRETELRAHELETVAKVSAAATSILDVDELLTTVTELTETSFNLYHVYIYLLDESNCEFVLSPARDTQAAEKAPGCRITCANEHSVVAKAGRTRQTIIVNDITQKSAFPMDTLFPETCSEMAVPMVVGDKLIGILDVHSQEINRFSEADGRVMATLADMIAVAVQNARLYAQAQELAALGERNRLARELHDSVSQALYGIALGARTARILLDRDPSRVSEPLDYVLSLAEAGLIEMRTLIFDLRPESLENEGLMVALSKQVASLRARHQLPVEANLCEEPNVPLEIKEAVYRIAREALHNTVKHAKAKHVRLHIDGHGDAIMMEIADDGVGFDTNESFPGHLGLQSMRERVARLEGIFELDSAPGRGTQIRVRIPVWPPVQRSKQHA